MLSGTTTLSGSIRSRTPRTPRSFVTPPTVLLSSRPDVRALAQIRGSSGSFIPASIDRHRLTASDPNAAADAAIAEQFDAAHPPRSMSTVVDIPDDVAMTMEVLASDDELGQLCHAAPSAGGLTLFGKKMRVIAGRVGRGSYGTTRLICDEDNTCRHVVKLVPINDVYDPTQPHVAVPKHFKVEAWTSKYASELGIAPKFYGSTRCLSGNGMILMERMDTTLAQFMINNVYISASERAIIAQKVYAVVDKMHDGGIYHQDLHTGNIMISMADMTDIGSAIVRVIDFGRAIVLGQPVPQFLRWCDLAMLYYGFWRHGMNDWDTPATMCGAKMPPPVVGRVPPIPTAAVIAIVCDVPDLYFSGGGDACPANRPGVNVYTQPELVYESLCELDGFAEFLKQVHDSAAEFGPFICSYSGRPGSRARCQAMAIDVLKSQHA